MKDLINRLSVFLGIMIIIMACQSGHETSGTMKMQIDRLMEYWNSGKFKGIELVLDPGFEMMMSPQFEANKGSQAFIASVLQTREAYPQFEITPVEIIGSGNTATCRWKIEAISKTGKKINVMGVSLFHFYKGKIKDEWIFSNDLLWMEQLGYQITPAEGENPQ